MSRKKKSEFGLGIQFSSRTLAQFGFDPKHLKKKQLIPGIGLWVCVCVCVCLCFIYERYHILKTYKTDKHSR